MPDCVAMTIFDLNEKQDGATAIFCDNRSNPMFHDRSKHIEIRHHFIRILVAKEEVKLEASGYTYQGITKGNVLEGSTIVWY